MGRNLRAVVELFASVGTINLLLMDETIVLGNRAFIFCLDAMISLVVFTGSFFLFRFVFFDTEGLTINFVQMCDQILSSAVTIDLLNS